MSDIVQQLKDAYASGDTSRMLGMSAAAANEIERLENLLATLAFYRDAYEKHLARGEALEKDNTRLYEQEALHTESYGIVCAERDRAVKALSDSVRWIPVSERAPEENQAVLAFWGKDRVHGIDAGARSYAVAVWGAGIWRDVDDPETEYGPATHWMPLPEAPK